MMIISEKCVSLYEKKKNKRYIPRYVFGYQTENIMQKFIITLNGTLEFGDVKLHRELIPAGEESCYGGGFWTIDNQRGMLLLYGRSFDFGEPEFSHLRRINRSMPPASLGFPIFYKKEVYGMEVLEPVEI